jgi:fatty acid desaturase
VLANLIVGISSGWWQNKHSRHHANPNKQGSDPDIDLAVLAFTPAQVQRHQNRIVRWLAAHQGWFFFPVLLLEGVSLHVSSIRRVFGRRQIERRWVELSFLTIRIVGYVTALFVLLPPGKAAAFLGVQLAVFGFYLGAAFAPNHIGMPIVSTKLRLDFLRRQVLMSRNVTGGRFMATLMGGLNYQIEHHLFPSMARPYLRRAQPIVAAYCAGQRVPYTRTGLLRSFRIIIGYLNGVGLRGTDPFLCPLVAERRSIQAYKSSAPAASRTR